MLDILSVVTAPALGGRTEQVLKRMLGMGEGEIGELRKEKVIYSRTKRRHPPLPSD